MVLQQATSVGDKFTQADVGAIESDAFVDAHSGIVEFFEEALSWSGFMAHHVVCLDQARGERVVAIEIGGRRTPRSRRS